MKNLLLLSFLNCIFFSSYSQKLDSTIFDSDFERNTFKTYCDSLPVKPIDFFIAYKYASNSVETEKNIQNFCNSLTEKGIDKLNRKKQIKEIYNQVHEKFFKKYEEEAYFRDIFINGTYNCVTASALYSLVFDYFKIDYSIKETPNHVYIIADPNSTSFLIETTLPSKGVIVFDDRFKKTYVDFLHSNKIISDSEYRLSSTNDLFQKNYESAKTITSIQLAAIQYFNKGVFSFNAKDYSTAAKNFEKANMVYPSPNIQFLYSSVLLNLLVDQNGKRKYDGKTLAKYTNINSSSQEALQVSKDQFRAVTNEMVINRPDLKSYTAFFNELITSLNDSIDKSDYQQVYHESMAYYFSLKNNSEKVLYHAGCAYAINPENIRTRQNVVESLFNYLQQDDKIEFLPLDSIVGYSDKFPFLLENQTFQQLLGFSFAKEFMEPGKKYKPEQIINSINNLEKFTLKLRNGKIQDGILEVIYSEASSAAVRSYNYDFAEAVLKKGLEVVPASSLLKSKLTTLSASKKDLNIYVKNSTYSAPSSQLINPPAYNDDQVYASVKKYMTKCWNVDFYKKDGKTKELKVEELKFIFYADNKMKFKTGTEEHWGTWKLNASGPTLVLKSNEDQEQFTILIYEASATQLRGIMAPYKPENKKIEFNICK